MRRRETYHSLVLQLVSPLSTWYWFNSLCPVPHHTTPHRTTPLHTTPHHTTQTVSPNHKIHHMHLAVSEDCGAILVQHRVWLASPMRE